MPVAKREAKEASEGANGAAAPLMAAAKDERLPVTLLSGFLGAGKTSLLMHILKNKAGLRCAVLVNDMAELNVDANLVKDGAVVQAEEQLVEMQNGCICCTLRADLVVEVAKMARQKKFDYLVIESTGISEPMQVAETFTMPVPVEDVMESLEAQNKSKTDGKPSDTEKPADEANDTEKSDAPDVDMSKDAEDSKSNESLQALTSLARLDTCVTVIDAANFDQTMTSVETVQEGEYSRVQRGGEKSAPAAEIPEEDDRTLVDLMVDQIEFADVIILNKTDVALPSQVEFVEGVVKTLNPNAQLLKAVKSKVPFDKVMGTGLFDFEKAAEMDAWKKDVSDIENGVQPKPETEEYNVGSFVFRALRPFHPERLHKFVNERFLMTVEYDDSEVEDVEVCSLPTSMAKEDANNSEAADLNEANGKGDDENAEQSGKEEKEEAKEDEGGQDDKEDGKNDDEGDGNGDKGIEGDDEEKPELISIEERRVLNVEMAKLCEADFGGRLLRSKGIAWMASKSARYFPIIWSQAGAFLSLSQQKPWDSEVAGFKPPAEEEDAKATADENGEVPEEGATIPPYGLEKNEYAMSGLDEKFVLGDKQTELVLIGHQIDKKRLRQCLEACLLTDEEITRLGAPVRDHEGWCDLEDPFGFPVVAEVPEAEDDDDDEEEGEKAEGEGKMDSAEKKRPAEDVEESEAKPGKKLKTSDS